MRWPEIMNHESNDMILPEAVENTPASADVLPGKVYIDTTAKTVKMVVAVGDDKSLTLASIGTWS